MRLAIPDSVVDRSFFLISIAGLVLIPRTPSAYNLFNPRQFWSRADDSGPPKLPESVNSKTPKPPTTEVHSERGVAFDANNAGVAADPSQDW